MKPVKIEAILLNNPEDSYLYYKYSYNSIPYIVSTTKDLLALWLDYRKNNLDLWHIIGTDGRNFYIKDNNSILVLYIDDIMLINMQKVIQICNSFTNYLKGIEDLEHRLLNN